MKDDAEYKYKRDLLSALKKIARELERLADHFVEQKKEELESEKKAA